MSTSGDAQYIGGYHDACGDTMSTSGGYHEYIGDIMSTSGFSTEIERLLSACSPTCIMISPNVLNIP